MSFLDKMTGDKGDKDIHKAVPVPQRLRKAERVAILTADDTEDVEFFYPYYRFHEEGYEVDVITPKGGKFKAKNGLGLSESLKLADVSPQDYTLLYIPGGKAPAALCKDDDAVAFVKAFAQAGKPIAAICHGPQLLAAADLVRGHQLAGWPEIADEIREAGGTFVDEALVEDRLLITARKPGDLHRHMYGVMQCLAGKVPFQDRDQRRAGLDAPTMHH